jgi:predicted nuclease of restriction endonuclease-like (RecB) superfamily
MKKSAENNKLYLSIKSLIEKSKAQIVRSVNTTITFTYFEIGRMIVENEQKGLAKAGYADKTLQQLSAHLTRDFGKGFSHRNLEYFRKFYLTYRSRISQSVIAKSKKFQKKTISGIPQPVAGKLGNADRKLPMSNTELNSQSLIAFSQQFKLSWTHYIQLLKIDGEDERKFYEIEAANNNWSVRELQRQFDASLYERLALSRDKKKVKELATKGQVIESPTDALKHHAVLEFLDLKEDISYSESDLETAIISRIEHFMMELGKGFLFEGRQKRFTFEGDSFYVDLVFYNRLLRCYVLIELKIGKLNHHDIGQLQMYVNYYDRKIKLPEENPSIGIILCKEENRTVVEFTLPENNNTIFAKEYKLYLPSKEQLKKQME